MLFWRLLVFVDHCSPGLRIPSDSPPSQSSVGKEEARLGEGSVLKRARGPILEQRPGPT